jgi:hypothetical protein
MTRRLPRGLLPGDGNPAVLVCLSPADPLEIDLLVFRAIDFLQFPAVRARVRIELRRPLAVDRVSDIRVK